MFFIAYMMMCFDVLLSMGEEWSLQGQLLSHWLSREFFFLTFSNSGVKGKTEKSIICILKPLGLWSPSRRQL
jgi:hypothetical protein